MVFVKLVKNSAYYKRYQTKFRRRREGKTDYQARKFLTFQAKNKYNTPKYRFVVRFTNTNIICQVAYATIMGDKILCSAQSKELKNHGLQVGLTNYSAAYATGLLLARRLLKQLGMDNLYKGVAETTGEAFDVYKDMEDRQGSGEEINRRPFKAYLDVGLVNTTRGNKVFSAMKGACDGGLHIPHSVKKFPGSSKDERKWSYDAAAHRHRIYGVHVQEWMDSCKEELDAEEFKKRFGKWDEFRKGRDLETIYKEVFESVKKNPDMVKTERKEQPKRVREGEEIKTSKGTYLRPKRLNNEQRKERVKQKIIKAASGE